MTINNDRWDELLSRWEALCAREQQDVAAREVWPEASPEELAELERRLNGQRLMRDLLNPRGRMETAGMLAETLHIPGYELVSLLGKGGYGQVW